MRWWYVLLAAMLGCAGANGNGAADAHWEADAAAGTPDAHSMPDAAVGADASGSVDAAMMADAGWADAEVTEADAMAPDALTGTDAGGVVAYSHTITIDGTNDFDVADEQLATSTAGFHTYVAWDDTYLYVGVDGTDVGSSSATHWVLIYLGGSGGSTTGQSYNTQEPALPFAARYHVGWRADNNLTQAQEYSASAWNALGWDFTGDVYQTGTFVEIRIPLADIGSPASLPLHVSMINEQGGGEWSFAGTPSASFTDGYDPDYGSYYLLDIGGATVPSAHTPQ